MAKYRRSKFIYSLALPFLVGTLAAAFSPLSLWYDMKEGLIAYLGFLAASVIQVMVVTANFLQSDRLNPTEAETLSKELTKQQHFWIGLLLASVVALVFVIIGAALKSHVGETIFPLWSGWDVLISWSAIVVFCVASSVAFVFYKMFSLLSGMLSLHMLRSELVIAASKRDAAEKAKQMQDAAKPSKSFVPDDYGAIVQPPDIWER